MLKAKYKDQRIAVKKFDEDSLAFNEKEFLSEMAIMFIFKHKNIVPLVGISTEPQNLFLAVKFYERGALDKIIYDPNFPLTLHRRISMLLDAAKGMKFLHSFGIIHRSKSCLFFPFTILTIIYENTEI